MSAASLTVIPVLVDGMSMPRPEELSDDIRALTQQQARAISDVGAHRAHDLKLLVGDIEGATGLVARQRRPRRRWSNSRLLIVAALLGMMLLVVAEIFWTPPPDAVEKLFVMLFALLVTMGGAWIKNRLTGNAE